MYVYTFLSKRKYRKVSRHMNQRKEKRRWLSVGVAFFWVGVGWRAWFITTPLKKKARKKAQN